MPLIPIAAALIQFVPSLMKMFGASEPSVEAAGRIVGVAQAVTGATSPEEALAMLQQNADKQKEFILAMSAQEKDLEKAYLVDTQSARNMAIELAKAGKNNQRPNILIAIAFIVLCMCIALMVWMSTANDFVKGSITFLMGNAASWINQAYNFEFGTTRSSTKKDDTIKTLSEG